MTKAMKALVFFSMLLGLGTAQAASLEAWDLIGDMEVRAASCAGNDKDKANISDITKKVNLFGTWKGSLDGKTGTATFSKDTSGNYKGKASVDGKSYGPYSVKVCDDGGSFYATVMGYKATFEVISKKKIKIYSPLDSSESIVMTKQ